MIMPDKNTHIRFSMLNGGALILSVLKEADTISSLRENTKQLEALSSYEKFVLTLDFLFAIGAITFQDGLLVRCANA